MKTKKAYYKKEIERAATVNELVYIDTEFRPDAGLGCGDLLDLCRLCEAKKRQLKAAGQKYTRATKPSWR